jgi:hypothetical protein
MSGPSAVVKMPKVALKGIYSLFNHNMEAVFMPSQVDIISALIKNIPVMRFCLTNDEWLRDPG